MTHRNIGAIKYKVAAAAIVLAYIGCFVGNHWLEARSERQATLQWAAEAGAAVVAQAPDPQIARVISLQARDSGATACGWVDLGAGSGIVPFAVLAVQSPYVVLPVQSQDSTEAWVNAAFEKQLVLQFCQARDRPATPPNVTGDPRVEGPLKALWSERGPDWAIIPVPQGGGYVAVARRTGGGATISPVMDTVTQAHAWSLGEGRAYAEAQNAKRRARMAASRACLSRHPQGDPEREHC
tara:strand:- start:846 stop:1562 length:717 start_codon:yes stop_codon:yes gene_type:complete